MGFDKQYPNRKDWRRQYADSAQRCDPSCRPHGGCPWDYGNRMIQRRREEERMDDSEMEWASEAYCE